MSRGDGKGSPPYIKIANTWLIVNVGGGPTPDKPTVTLRPPPNPDEINSFMNIRVADIQACYKLWRSRGATFSPTPSTSTVKFGVHPRPRRLHHRSRAEQVRCQVRLERVLWKGSTGTST